MDMWTDYINMHEFDCGDMCRMIKIMMSIPPNTGWIERSYSLLEIICQKRRNQMALETMRNLFLLAVLKLLVRDCFSYDKEIERMSTH